MAARSPATRSQESRLESSCARSVTTSSWPVARCARAKPAATAGDTVKMLALGAWKCKNLYKLDARSSRRKTERSPFWAAARRAVHNVLRELGFHPQDITVLYYSGARSTHSYPLSAAADTGKPARLKAQARELQTPTASLRHSCSLACPGAAAGRGGEAPAEIRRPRLFRNVARSANFKIACMFCARARACSAYGSSQAGLSWSLNISVARQHTGTATGGMPPAYSMAYTCVAYSMYMPPAVCIQYEDYCNCNHEHCSVAL